MKAYARKKELTFGELIVSVYSACGGQRARGLLRLAAEAHLVEFRGARHLVISQRGRG